MFGTLYQFQGIENMLKQSNLIFKELKNVKRSTAFLSHSMSKDIITSSKDIRNTRSTKQIDITSYMENKNDKIKNIDEKLEVHQSEIQRNNQMIEELNFNFVSLKEQLDREKESTKNEERKNKLLREQIERTNKILRAKNSKIEESARKICELQRDNEIFRTAAAKCEEYAKTINSLRAKIVQIEENAAELKSSLTEKERDFQKQKEKISYYEVLKAREEDLNGQISMKDMLIGNLKSTINELSQEHNKELNEKGAYERKIERLTEEIDVLKVAHRNLNMSLSSMEKKYMDSQARNSQLESQMKSGDSKLQDKEKEEGLIKKECSELKERLAQVSGKAEEGGKELAKRDAKIDKLNQKIKELQSNIGDSYKDREKVKTMQEKLGALKKKGQNLQNVYYTIIPQIQCPFGHELHNPVTIIPCGHNYCLGCKKGYVKDCMQCCGKLKIEAVYRNELMDDIIGMVSGIKQVIQLLK